MTFRFRTLSIAVSTTAATALLTSMTPANALVEDYRPPEITAVPDRPSAEGWFDGPVTYTAKATEPNADDTGVKTFSYKVGGAQTGSGSLSTTNGGTVRVSNQGRNTIEFEAYDNAFNVNYLTVDANIDLESPRIYWDKSFSTVVALNDTITVAYHCDDTGSGIASCVGTVPSKSQVDT